jgi:YD repeat-containing protein
MLLTARRLARFPILLLAASVSAQNFVTFQGAGAETLFRQSRNAIGGEAAVMNVSSLVMKGIVRVSAGDDGPPERTIEIRMLLPDQYVRIETAKDWVKRSGFSEKTLLTEIRANGQADRPPANMWAGLLRGERGRFARLLLGLGSLVTPEVWLTLRQPAGVTELGSAFETGRTTNVSSARVLEATARDGFTARVFYDATGVPLRVEYEASGRRIATVFSDRRKVGPLMLPHTITTTLNGMPLEAITITEIVINPALAKADFESR